MADGTSKLSQACGIGRTPLTLPFFSRTSVPLQRRQRARRPRRADRSLLRSHWQADARMSRVSLQLPLFEGRRPLPLPSPLSVSRVQVRSPGWQHLVRNAEPSWSCRDDRRRDRYDDRPRYDDRDRGGRYDDRRGPPPGRFDDRRGGPPRDGFRGGGGGGGGGGGRRGTRGENGVFGSPNIRRSPTPEGTIPISKRSRKYTAWDVKAPGYESMNAMEAKFSGESDTCASLPRREPDVVDRRLHASRPDSPDAASHGRSFRSASDVP